ncbi:hypothetical protein TPA0908_22560 [Micromonospora sp. AKA38]|nr:hypothetical protein TPA0908_22560 [Micromonospora sp. AKA38]
MPYGASATASDCAIAFIPALLAPYAGLAGSPRNAPREETFTIRPPRSRMCWAAHQAALAAPTRLVSSTSRQRARHCS